MKVSNLRSLSILGVFAAAGCDMYVQDEPRPSRHSSTLSISVPRLVLVTGTRIEYAPEEQEDIFYYRGTWYNYREGIWFNASYSSGPWVTVRRGRLPSAFAKVPPGQFRYNKSQFHPVHDHHPGRGYDRVEEVDEDGKRKKRRHRD